MPRYASGARPEESGRALTAGPRGVSAPHTPCHGVGIRNQKELKTLAQALDAIQTGNLCLAGDTLMQRLKALEQASADGTWAAAEYLEVTPRGSATSVPQEEREQALGEARRAARSEAALRRVTPRQES